MLLCDRKRDRLRREFPVLDANRGKPAPSARNPLGRFLALRKPLGREIPPAPARAGVFGILALVSISLVLCQFGGERPKGLVVRNFGVEFKTTCSTTSYASARGTPMKIKFQSGE